MLNRIDTYMVALGFCFAFFGSGYQEWPLIVLGSALLDRGLR